MFFPTTWIQSSSFFWVLVQLSQITSPYSKSGLMNEKYMISRDFLSKTNLSLRIMLILSHAFLLMWSIWSCHVHAFERKIPRCLWEGTSDICLFNIKSGGWFTGVFFLEIRIDSVLAGLKVTSHLLDQEMILFMSDWSILAADSGSSTIWNKLVSSAKSFISEPISSTISLMNTKNKRGPSTDPWGTPALIIAQLEIAPDLSDHTLYHH